MLKRSKPQENTRQILSLQKRLFVRVHPERLDVMVPFGISWTDILSLAKHIDVDVRFNGLSMPPKPVSRPFLLHTGKLGRDKVKVSFYETELIVEKRSSEPLRVPYRYIVGYVRHRWADATSLPDL